MLPGISEKQGHCRESDSGERSGRGERPHGRTAHGPVLGTRLVCLQVGGHDWQEMVPRPTAGDGDVQSRRAGTSLAVKVQGCCVSVREPTGAGRTPQSSPTAPEGLPWPPLPYQAPAQATVAQGLPLPD